MCALWACPLHHKPHSPLRLDHAEGDRPMVHHGPPTQYGRHIFIATEVDKSIARAVEGVGRLAARKESSTGMWCPGLPRSIERAIRLARTGSEIYATACQPATSARPATAAAICSTNSSARAAGAPV